MHKLASNSLSSLLVVTFLCLLNARAIGSTEVFILHTNNTNGALENCLCPGKSYGSLEKRAVFVREWLQEHPNTLLVDAGDFLSATGNTLKDSIAFRAYGLMEYDAVGLGDQEFFGGVSFLTGLMEGTRLPFVSSNLVQPASSPELWRASLRAGISRDLIVERAGIRFGILSLMDPEGFRFYPARVSDSVAVRPPLEVLDERLDELKVRSDLVILLSHLGVDRDREIARSHPGIDVIVGGHTQAVIEEPEKVGNTLIVQAGKDGYYVGRLKLTLDNEKNITGYEGDLVAMDIDLPNDPTVVNMIVEYNRLSRMRAGGVVERIPPIPDRFLVGAAQACSGCHKSEYEQWMTTGHARAFETLLSDHKEKSPQCLVCHTTGFGRDDGYLNYNITLGLKNVTCTECHYVAPAHADKPLAHPAVVISEANCIRCHDAQNSPAFEFEPFLARIIHPVIVIHMIRSGETLWSLAERYLGSGLRWTEIYDVNRGTIHNPHVIREGQEVTIPSVRSSGR